jgi:hypothetical protein
MGLPREIAMQPRRDGLILNDIVGVMADVQSAEA